MAPRRNPTGPAVSLVAIAFRRQPELLRELRAAEGEPTIDNAAQLLADMSGRSQTLIRASALATLSSYIRRFVDPEKALKWIYARDRRLGVWCACACARLALPLTDKRRAPKVAIDTAEDWVRGKASAETVKKVADAARVIGREEANYGDAEVEFASRAAAIAASSVNTAGVIGGVVTSVTEAYQEQAENEVYSISQNDPSFNGRKADTFVVSAWMRMLPRMMDAIVEAIVTFPEVVPLGKKAARKAARKARKNPAGPSVTLVAIAFRKQPELLRELRDTKGPATIDNAALLLSGWTGQSYENVRQRALATLARYTRGLYAGDKRRRGGLLATQRIIMFLIERSHTLGVWCACQCARAVFEQTTEPQARFCVMAAERWVRDDEIDANLPGFINAARTSTPLGGRGEFASERAIIKDASNWACSYAAESIANRSVAQDCVESAYDVAKYRVGMFDDGWLMDVIEKAIITFPSRI